MSLVDLQTITGWLDEFLWPEEDGRQRSKRARILEAATALMVRYGYRKTSIDEVARAAGVAKGTVYLYYQNKAELVFHAVALEKRNQVGRIGPLFDGAVPALDRLAALIELGLSAMAEMPLLTRLSADQELMLALTEVDAPVLEQVNEWQTAFLVELLDEASSERLSRTDLVGRAQVLIDLVRAIVSAPRAASMAQPLEQYTRTVADILVRGVIEPSVPATSERLSALIAAPAQAAGPLLRQGASS